MKKNNLGVKILGFQALTLSWTVLTWDELSTIEGVGKIMLQPLTWISLNFWYKYFIKYIMKKQNVSKMKYLTNLKGNINIRTYENLIMWFWIPLLYSHLTIINYHVKLPIVVNLNPHSINCHQLKYWSNRSQK